MTRSIAINGTRLDKVQMLMEPESPGFVAYLRYPKSQIRVSYDDNAIRLVIPAYLCVELYRTGVLPQDASTAVTISIGGTLVGRYTVTDVRYPSSGEFISGGVIFTLSRVPRAYARSASARPMSRPTAARVETYVTNITHYLDESGELAPLPGPALKLASFLTLLIEAATCTPSASEHDSGIRCRAKACRGIIRTVLVPGQDEISWNCPVCGQNGVIRNWYNTKWNQLKRTGEPQ